MLIKQLYIKGFGKFNNKKIELSKGLNVIYGLNEAGKSTLHQFIEGMLFGFFNPGTKTKKYTAKYDRFLPWNRREGYEGVMVVQLGERDYRIERNFLKRHDALRIYDEVTGEELTGQLAYNSIVKLPDLSEWMGLTETTFKNTLSIGQLEARTEKELATELKDHLTNLSYTKDQDISVDQVIKGLDRKLEAIGTERRSQSPLGRITLKIEELNHALDHTEQVLRKAGEKRESLEALKAKEKHAQKRLKSKEDAYYLLEQKALRERRIKAQGLAEDIKQLEQRLSQLKGYQGITGDEIEEGLKLQEHYKLYVQQKKVMEQEVDKHQSQLETIDEQIRAIGFETLTEDTLVVLEKVPYEYEQLQRASLDEEQLIWEIDALREEIKGYESLNIQEIFEKTQLYDSYDQELQRMKAEHHQLKHHLTIQQEKLKYAKSRWYVGTGIVFFLLAVIILGVMNFTGHSIGAIVSMLIGLISIGKAIILSREEKRIKADLSDYENKLKAQEEDINERERIQREILAHYNLQEGFRLKGLKEEAIRKQMKYEETTKLISQKEEQLKGLRQKQEGQKEKLLNLISPLNIKPLDLSARTIEQVQFLIKKIRQLMNERAYTLHYLSQLKEKQLLVSKDIATIEESSQRLEPYGLSLRDDLEEVKKVFKVREQGRTELENKKKLYHEILQGDTLENLTRRIKIEVEAIDIDEGITKEAIEVELIEAREDVIEIGKAISREESSIKDLILSVKAVGEIEVALAEANQEKELLQKQSKALQLAKETLLNIANDIHQNFAPQLNEALGSIVDKITEGKYTKMRVTHDMDLLVEEPLHNKLIPVEQLSNGTIDQMYLGLRLGALELMKGNKAYPLILDDAFTQYDDERLKRVLKWLAKETYEQILLFTCQNREGAILEELESDYHMITL